MTRFLKPIRSTTPTQRSPLAETLASVLPDPPPANLPPEEDLLTSAQGTGASESFFYRNFAHFGLEGNLYDRNGARQIDPLLQEAPGFPAVMKMPQDAVSGCAFVVHEETLYFLYDRLERWEDAPEHLAFVALRIAPEALIELSESDLSPTSLSRSEYVLLAMLLAGHSLASAAEALGARYDTKRKQIQRVLEKFGADSQTSLLRRLSLEITARLLDALLARARHKHETALLRRQFGRDVVINSVTIGAGGEVPVWEFGSRRGRPILYFHNMLSPLAFQGEFSEQLCANDLRWLVVPRHFLGQDMPVDADRRMAHLTRALSETVAHLIDAPLICLGDSAGVSWAVHFARHNPGMIDHLVLSATPQPLQLRTSDQPLTLYGELSERLRRDIRVTAGLARIYNALARVPGMARKGLRHLYRHSPADLATLEELFAQAYLLEWLRVIATVGTNSSMDELRGLQRNWLADLKTLDCAISFVHGLDDTISPIAEIESLGDIVKSAAFLRF